MDSQVPSSAISIATKNELCAICSTGCPVWPTRHLQASVNCPMCRLVTACISMGQGNSRASSSTLDSKVIGTVRRGEIWLQLVQPRGPYDDEDRLLYSEYAIRDCPDDTNFLEYPSSGPAMDYLSSIKRWISYCQTHHVHQQQSDRQLPPLFRLIDLHSNNLVTPELLSSERMSYWALSYVWGGGVKFTLTSDNINKLHEPGSPEQLIQDGQLPKTILDTINLCRNAGQRYLWIDSMCILQDCMEKHDQVCAMDTIYSRADLVVVATHSGSDAGLLPDLPDGTPPNEYRMEQVSGRRLVACPSLWGASAEVCRSTWHSRGWTMQEYALSRRAAIFTKRYCFLTCGDELFDVHFDLTDPVHLSEHDELKRPEIMPATERGTAFFRLIRQYLNRNLSYPEDILNALEGVLSRCLQGPGRHFWGLPEVGFGEWFTWHCAYGLCSLDRRDEKFPSWSWAAWIHEGISCCLDGRVHPTVDIYRLSDTGCLIQLNKQSAKLPGLPGEDSMCQTTSSAQEAAEMAHSYLDQGTLSSTCLLWTSHVKIVPPQKERRNPRTGNYEVPPTPEGDAAKEYILISAWTSISAMEVEYSSERMVYYRRHPYHLTDFSWGEWIAVGARSKWILLA